MGIHVKLFFLPFPLLPSQAWNIHTYAVVHAFPEQNHWVRALVVHGKSLFSGSYKTVKVREDIAQGVRGRGLLPWSGGSSAAVREELHSHFGLTRFGVSILMSVFVRCTAVEGASTP